MVSPTFTDVDITETISRVKTKLLSNCGDLITSEGTIKKMCSNQLVQAIVPFIIVIISIILIRPNWSYDQENKKYKYYRVVIVSIIIYVLVISLIIYFKNYLL